MKIDIIGSYPPPYGGIATHVKRLSEHLKESGIEYTVYDTAASLNADPKRIKAENVVPVASPIKWALQYMFSTGAEIVHLDAADNWQLRLYAGLALGLIRRKKLIITINGNDISWPYAISCLRKPDSGFIGRLLAGLIIRVHRQAAYVTCTNDDIRELMLASGIRPERTGTVSAFIPPVVRETDATDIPQEILDFIGCHRPVISAGAFRINFYGGQDIYGLDMCVELCANLKKACPDIGLVFCLPVIGDEAYLTRMQGEIRAKGIEDNFLLITRPVNEVYTIWQQSHIFVRPTLSDGDAVSLREALYLKTPSVASDVVPRPEGTILFKTRDMEDFTARVKMVWEDYDYYKSRAESIEVASGLNQIMDVYQRLTGKNRG